MSNLRINSSYFEPHYECEKCKDTGYITNDFNTVMCNCLKQKLYDNPIEITIDKNNRIIKYKDNNTKTLPDDFMNKNTVETLEMNSLEEAGDNFFKISPELKNVSLPNLKKIGNQGFMGTKILEYVEFPNLEEVGDSFFIFI